LGNFTLAGDSLLLLSGPRHDVPKENPMKSAKALFLAVVICLFCAASTRAQMGMDWFKKPNIADILNPVVGHGGVYETSRSGSGETKTETMEMTVVGKDTFEGKEAFWLEVAHTDKGGTGYAKMLITKDDFQFHRMIMQQPGQQAMEFPFNPGMTAKQHMKDETEKWHSVGTETITVAAGTFSCEHWKKDSGDGEVWVSKKVSPFSLVKQVSPNHTMVLVKVLTDAQDHITGPVKTFDPQAMREQMIQQMQKQRQSQQPQQQPPRQ
jgi:hypothetical protein